MSFQPSWNVDVHRNLAAPDLDFRTRNSSRLSERRDWSRSRWMPSYESASSTSSSSWSSTSSHTRTATSDHSHLHKTSRTSSLAAAINSLELVVFSYVFLVSYVSFVVLVPPVSQKFFFDLLLINLVGDKWYTRPNQHVTVLFQL